LDKKIGTSFSKNVLSKGSLASYKKIIENFIEMPININFLGDFINK